MKRLISFLLAAVMLCGISVSADEAAYTHPFRDVRGHWAEDYINQAYENKMVNGDPDGRFRPDDAISRAEFLKMLVSIICERNETYVPDEFGDGTHWASKYYNFATQYIYRYLDEDSAVGGIIPGKMSAEDFDKPIGRWEMSYIVSEAVKNVCGVKGWEQETLYADAEEVAENYSLTVADAINNSYFLGVMTGDENGNINAADGGTRAEAVVIVNRVDGIMLQIIAAAETAQQQQQQAQEEYEKQVAEALTTYEEIPEGHPVVTIVMSDGQKIMIELYPEYAPQTVANFVALVKSGFYNGLTFHRIVEGFMAQGGDPNGDGTGGSEHNIVGEFAANGFEENTLSHTRGVISMARSSHPDSASSQFFICYDDASFLDGQYAAFGKVIMGMDVVDSFLKVERTANEMGENATPVEPITMRTVTVNAGK